LIHFTKRLSIHFMMFVEDKMKEIELDVTELKQLIEKAQRPKVKDLLQINVRKLETDLSKLRDEKEKQDSRLKNQTSSDVATSTAKSTIIPDSQIKDYSWDQSERFVKLYLTNFPGLNELSDEAFKIKYTDESLEIRIENYKGKNLVFNINKTCHKINPEKSYHKVKSDYLLVFISKHNPGSNWSHFTHADKMNADANKMKTEPKLDDKEDPSASLMNMMKKMYEDGDDDMKRTIAKAWTEGQQNKMQF